jgi:hypothetical protein
MIATKKYIQELREKNFIKISTEAEKLILEKLGEEPGLDDEGCWRTYKEQDLWEQVRKIIQDNP